MRIIAALLAGLAFGSFFASEALAQADPFETLKVGQRIEVVLKNNTVFRGDIHWIAGDRLKLDVTYDTTELQGYLMFKRGDIKRIVSLQTLSDKEKERILEEKNSRLVRLEEEAEARRKAEAQAAVAAAKKDVPVDEYKDLKAAADERARQRRTELLAKFPPGNEWNRQKYADLINLYDGGRTDLEKEFVKSYGEWLAAQESSGKEDRRKLLEKFPPEKGWGPEKYEELRVKALSSLHTGRPTHIGGQRTNNGRTRPPMTDEEQEFYDRFEEWKLGLKEFIEEKKAEGVKPGGEPAGGGEGGTPPGGAGGSPPGGAGAGGGPGGEAGPESK